MKFKLLNEIQNTKYRKSYSFTGHKARLHVLIRLIMSFRINNL